jgi:hypothetical protein
MWTLCPAKQNWWWLMVTADSRKKIQFDSHSPIVQYCKTPHSTIQYVKPSAKYGHQDQQQQEHPQKQERQQQHV